jgi:hypothetical protein
MAGYYVAFKGRVPGIYLTWQECSKHVLYFKGSVHKRYTTYDEAIAAYMAGHPTAAPPEIIPYAQIRVAIGDSAPAAEIEMTGYDVAPAAQIGVHGTDGYLCCSMRLLCLLCAFFFSDLWLKKTFS